MHYYEIKPKVLLQLILKTLYQILGIVSNSEPEVGMEVPLAATCKTKKN